MTVTCLRALSLPRYHSIHGQPFAVGEFVWLHNTHVPLGHSRKLHCPWSGPYLVVECLSDVMYRIRSVYGKNCEQVVHFDHLKPCPHDIRLEATSQQPVEDAAMVNSWSYFQAMTYRNMNHQPLHLLISLGLPHLHLLVIPEGKDVLQKDMDHSSWMNYI